ncbi:MAG: CRTAC1 family protein, partial [Bryobacteraceae bacterium]
MKLTRRQILLAGAGTGALWTPRIAGQPKGAGTIFDEIAPQDSGIRWTHDNAMSDMRYLPETMGPGVAFLDYDRDGWMDLYLVNSGPCDFWKPAKPVRSALYKN